MSVMQGESRSKPKDAAKLNQPFVFIHGSLPKALARTGLGITRHTAQPPTVHITAIPAFASRGVSSPRLGKYLRTQREGQRQKHSHLRRSQASGCVSPRPGCPLEPPSLWVDSWGQPKVSSASCYWGTLEDSGLRSGSVADSHPNLERGSMDLIPVK